MDVEQQGKDNEPRGRVSIIPSNGDNRMSRISEEDLLMEMCYLISKRTSCRKYAFGAVISKDKQLLSTGYNGAPAGLPHCIDKGCRMEKKGYEIGTRHESCRAVHAEQNAIIQCAKWGVSCQNADLYVNGEPCRICARMIINAGVKRVVYVEGVYTDSEGNSLDKQGPKLLRQAGVELVVYSKKR